MPGLDKIQILLVEDSVEDAELMLNALKQSRIPADCHCVEDGAEALEFLLQNEPRTLRRLKVIFLDLQLPKIDGFEVLRQIRRTPHIRSIPVVVLTSSRESRDLEAAYELGVNSYIVKPVNAEDFMDIVEQLAAYWLVLNIPQREE